MTNQTVEALTTAAIEALEELRTARTLSTELKAERSKMIDEVKAKPEYQALDGAANEAAETIDQLEKFVRDTVLELNELGADLPDKTGVKYWDKIVIPDDRAIFEWALTHMAVALTLNISMIEKHVTQYPGSIPETLAFSYKEPRANIATKLS